MIDKKELDAAFKASKDFKVKYARILVRREKSALEQKAGKAGLLTPDTVKDNYKSSWGVLIKCGDSCESDTKASVGKRILFARYSGDEIKIGDEEFWFGMEDDIFGIDESWSAK